MSETLSRGVSIPPSGTRLPIQCRCCGGNEVEMVLDLGDQPHCNRLVALDLPAAADPGYPLRLGFCHHCTLVQIDHTLPKESMFSNYPYVSGTTRTLTEHFRQTATRLSARYELTERDLVVDIGSNDGSWLAQYGSPGPRVLGIEAAANIAGLAHRNGVPTWNRFFNAACASDIKAAHGPAKLITAAGVFFHLEELHSVVEGIAALLDTDGVFVVQAIYLGGMLRNTAFDQIYHEHLCYYTLRSLADLLGRHDLEVFDASLVPIHGGSIEAHVARRGSRPVQASVQALAKAEVEQAIDDIATYRAFARKVVKLQDDLTRVLREFAATGRSVWAYGAPAKGATLLNSFGIGRDLVPIAVEKNPLKIGLAIPGVRIPIRAEGNTKPAAYLVLAWNFLDEFLAKEAAYLANGGAFIVPVPDVRIIAGPAR